MRPSLRRGCFALVTAVVGPSVLAPQVTRILGVPFDTRGEAADAIRHERFAIPAPVTTILLPRLVQPSETMSSAEIRAALDFGRRRGEPDLVEVKTRILPFGSRRTVRLLTPFWRVATLARIAAVAGQPLPEGEVPALFTQRLVWIVALPAEYYTYDEGDMDSPQYLAFARKIVIRPKGSASDREDIQPAWTMPLDSRRKSRGLEGVFGPYLGKADFLTAFPMDAFEPGNTILVTYGSAAGVKPQVRRMVLTEKHLRNWK